MKIRILALCLLGLSACGEPVADAPENPRSYDAWMGSTYAQKVSFAAGHYYKTSANITEVERDTLIENGMVGLNSRASTLVDCTIEITPPEVDKSADYFSFIVSHCMEKLAI